MRRLRYDDNLEFNDYIDENNDQVQIFKLTYQPSEVLFNVDQDAYRSILSEYTPDDQT